MNINFPLILVILTAITGLIWAIDAMFFAPRRIRPTYPKIVDYSRSFFPILLAVLIIRSFFAEPFRIPTGSLEPTLLVGDFILVNKYDYGLRLPDIDKKVAKIGEPKRGDLVVFHWPPKPSIDYIKRVIGVPGDKISYIDKVIYINDVQANQKLLGATLDQDGIGNSWKVTKKEETLNGVIHNIYVRPDIKAQNFYNIVVPKDQYFVMGDNRDDSEDSRYWGFVPEKNLVGKAVAIWLSWNSNATNVRWERIGKMVH